MNRQWYSADDQSPLVSHLSGYSGPIDNTIRKRPNRFASPGQRVAPALIRDIVRGLRRMRLLCANIDFSFLISKWNQAPSFFSGVRQWFGEVASFNRRRRKTSLS